MSKERATDVTDPITQSSICGNVAAASAEGREALQSQMFSNYTTSEQVHMMLQKQHLRVASPYKKQFRPCAFSTRQAQVSIKLISEAVGPECCRKTNPTISAIENRIETVQEGNSVDKVESITTRGSDIGNG